MPSSLAGNLLILARHFEFETCNLPKKSSDGLVTSQKLINFCYNVSEQRNSKKKQKININLNFTRFCAKLLLVHAVSWKVASSPAVDDYVIMLKQSIIKFKISMFSGVSQYGNAIVVNL